MGETLENLYSHSTKSVNINIGIAALTKDAKKGNQILIAVKLKCVASVFDQRLELTANHLVTCLNVVFTPLLV